LRWKICKTLKVPADDPLFDRMNNPQWLWYAAQFAADDKERFELFRDMAEYNASFWNPEGVDQVRRAREKAFIVNDKDFARQVEETFGRKLKIPERKEGLPLPLPVVPKNTPVRKRMRPDVDGSPYLEAELDEVRFVPLRR
jgi:hypothetical protein